LVPRVGATAWTPVPDRFKAMHFLRDGVVSIAEAARLLGLTDHAVKRWLVREGLTACDVKAARRRYVERLWRERR
jgi:hypothetical protein